MSALDRSMTAIQIFLKKFLKSPFRFKRNFYRFKILLDIFAETFLIYGSFINEILFFNHIINWLIQWRNLIQFLVKESLCITTIVYALYFILLGLFGILVGFLLGLYRRKYQIEDIYLFFLLLLFYILSHKGFDDILLDDLSDSSIATNTEEFSFKLLPQIKSRSVKLILKQTEQIQQIPFLILDDPSLNIQIDFVWEESIQYKFQLFELYQNLNEKVNY